MTYSVVRRRDPAYPELLRQLHDPPPQLYLRGGSPALLKERAVAIVGARSCSPYGAQVARMLGRELGAVGVIVVSGLARGIDAEAHRGALEANGSTLAVLGCGIDRDYPRRHAELAARITVDGLIVSEYPPGTEPAPWRFPARNRIVAGLSVATIVVEARVRSGALITADFALELGREVFAIPGEITSGLSFGSNDLLRQGATPLLAVSDVLEVLGISPSLRKPKELSRVASDVLQLLGDRAQDADGLTRASGRTSAEVGVALVELELAGLVVSADGVYRVVATV